MIDEVFKLKLIGTKDCFLHFSTKGQNKITNNSSSVIKLKNDSIKNELYFTSNPNFCPGFDENTVGISSVYANHLGLNDDETVILSSYNQVPVVKKVFVSALTQDDFEIMEMSQYELQLAMLNQIRVISVGQIITTWFSKTMYCSICVDSMEPLLKVGKIEQFTDIIISPVLKELSNNQSEQNCADISKDLSEENVNGLKINSFINNENIIEDSPLKLNKVIKKKEHSGIFRIIAGKDISDCCDDLHNPIAHPYNAFVNEDILTLWSNKSTEDSAVVCFATKVPVKFTKGFYEQCQKGVGSGLYIRLYPIREDCKTIPPVQNGCNWKNQGLYVSDTVKSLLSVKTGSKVKLKIFVPNLDVKVTLVDIAIPNSLTEYEVGNWFREELPSSSNVLINNKSLMPIRSSSGIVESVVVTFWPDTILCWPFSSAEMKTCKLNIGYCLDVKESEKSDDLDSEQDKQDSDDENGSDEAHGKRAFESISQLSGSLKDIIKDGLISFEQCLKLSSVPVLPQNLSLQQNNNILCVGSGAYFLCDWLCNWVSGPPHNVYITKIDCKALKGKKGDNLQKRLVEKLLKCIYYQPSLLVLLDIDGIAGTPSQPENKVEEIFFRGMSRMVRDILIENQADQHICVLATARTTSCINTEILGPQGNHLFSTLLQIPTLTKVDRVIIVKEIIKMKHNKNNISNINFEEFANRTEGYSYEDLTLLVDKALFKAWQRKALNKKCDALQVTLEDLLFAVDSYSPAHLHSINLYKSSDHSWLTVGGMKALKESLTEIIIWPSKYKEVYEQCPLRSESGVLLYGVPGTGKTLLASALAGEAGLNFISIKGPELLSKYIGASEEAVRNVFDKAKKAKPCILFFDEFDSLAPKRGHDSSGVMDRVVNQLLTQMDGVEERTGVYVVAATSRPDLLDPALLRPGRIGHLLHCPLPEVDDRLAIMTVLCKKLVLDSDCNLSFIAEQTDRYSGADLQAVIYGAQMMAYDELNQNNSNSARELDDFTIEVEPDISKKLVVRNKHLLSSLDDTKPSLRLEELRRYNKIYENFQKLRSKTNQGVSVPVVMDQKVSLA